MNPLLLWIREIMDAFSKAMAEQHKEPMPGEDGMADAERENAVLPLADCPPTEGEIPEFEDQDQFTANFHRREFDSKDGAAMPLSVRENVRMLAYQLQILRNTINKPIHINSGYRSPAHNSRIGGARNSQHLTGKAADITVRGMSPAQVSAVIERMIKEGRMLDGGIGVYSSFVHYDIGTPRRWRG